VCVCVCCCSRSARSIICEEETELVCTKCDDSFDKKDMEVLAAEVVAVSVCVDSNCVLSVSGFHCDGLNPAAGMELIISNICSDTLWTVRFIGPIFS